METRTESSTPPSRLPKNTMASILTNWRGVISLSGRPMTNRQSPVKSSAPNKITIIKPTGNTTEAASLDKPTLVILCAATLLAAAPIAIIMPAKTLLPMMRPVGISHLALQPLRYTSKASLTDKCIFYSLMNHYDDLSFLLSTRDKVIT